MIAFYLSPLYIGFLVLLLIFKIKYFKSHPSKTYRIIGLIITIIILIIPFTLFVSHFLENSSLKTLLTNIGNYWLGFSVYFFSCILISVIVRSVFKLCLKQRYNVHIARTISNLAIVLISVIVTIYGSFNAYNIKTTNYTVYSDKESSATYMRVVLVADLHLGYNFGLNQTQDMVNKINELKPDIVVIAGDIFDNDYAAIDEPEKIAEALKSIKSNYGNYLVLGNHDTEEKRFVGFSFKESRENNEISSEMLDFINQTGFKLLYDEAVKIHDENGKTLCVLYGRPDKERINFGNSQRIEAKGITKDLDMNNYIICVDHEPVELNELNEAGVDLLLSGHTHNGQLFPANFLVDLMSENGYGKKDVGNLTSVVTSGIGTFGPNMRVGTNVEIVNINLNFN